MTPDSDEITFSLKTAILRIEDSCFACKQRICFFLFLFQEMCFLSAVWTHSDGTHSLQSIIHCIIENFQRVSKVSVHFHFVLYYFNGLFDIFWIFFLVFKCFLLLFYFWSQQ